VLDTGVGSPALIYTAQGGVVQILVDGNEDPVFGSISAFAAPSQNDFGDIVFVSQKSGFPSDYGLFTGNDPIQDKVVRKGDVLLGGTFTDINGVNLQTGPRNINNSGQIAFVLTVTDPSGNLFTHIVRADPVVDTDGDGILPDRSEPRSRGQQQ